MSRPDINPPKKPITNYASNPLIKIDITKKATEEPNRKVLHNRWHPDIPAAAKVDTDQVFRVESIDWLGGQIKNDDSSDDVRDADLSVAHYLSGPIHVNGAEPGDVIVVDLLDVGPHPDAMWGYNGIFDRCNGGGLLTHEYPAAGKTIWDFNGIYATTRHIPGVKFAGIPHPGLFGTAPSQELLDKWNKREKELVDTDAKAVPALAHLPEPKNALFGSLKESDSNFQKMAKEGARTVPPREHGGNVDVKNLSRGSRCYLPVYVSGAKLSIGDLHFSQGDGEITFCGAIEMPGFVDMSISIIKGGMTKGPTAGLTNPLFLPGPIDPHYSNWLVFEGMSVTHDGKQRYMDATLAYQNACLNAIRYFRQFGYDDKQVYSILGCAPVEGRIGGLVDVPNALCTLSVPREIFQFDVSPSTQPQQINAKGKMPESKRLANDPNPPARKV